MSLSSVWTSFKSRIAFWLKKSPLETAPGDLVELGNLLIELSEVICRQSVLSVISELPQLTKFLYRIVTEPSFRVILVTKRVSLSFCRCLHIFIRSPLEGALEESVSEQRRQEISTKSRDWALMVLKLALFPRWMDQSTSQATVQSKLVSSVANCYYASSRSWVLVQKQMRKDLVDWIDYQAFHITKKHPFAEHCSVLCCPYNMETHWKRMKDMGLFILSIIHSSGEEEEHWSFPILYHWLLSTVYLHSPSSCSKYGSILQLQTKGLVWEPNKGYTSQNISLRIPQPWTTLPLPVAYRLLSENNNLLREYCDWLESLVLKHLFLSDMILLDNDVLTYEHRFLLLEIIREPLVVCWMRAIWFEKIECCSDKWNQRILISFWNEITQHCHSSVTYSWKEEDVLKAFHLQQSISSHFGMNVGLDFDRVDHHLASTRDEACFVRKYFWDSICSVEHQIVIACLKVTFRCLSEEEFRSHVTVLSKWWCIPSLSYSLSCWNAESYHLFLHIWHRYDALIQNLSQPHLPSSVCCTNHESTLSNIHENSSHIQMQKIFVDILFHTLTCLHTDCFSFQLLDSTDGYILLYMKIMEIMLKYCTGHPTLWFPRQTQYPRLVHLYQQVSNEYSTTTDQEKRRYQLFCQHILGMNHPSSHIDENQASSS
ncbi:hypothetical protein GpartN1_g1062.t1 [Galdieria partita]|uniref:Uncharacterized protein n=1 Tax=Galdieria partita TaxID=83374 RepID=A0A9C7PSZ7_9RHOD|nr:hypothetical protein GpartN1_g1062.t1 [Galdieria partita]